MYNAPTEIVESKLEVVLGQKRCTKPKDGRLQSSKRLPSHATLALRHAAAPCVQWCQRAAATTAVAILQLCACKLAVSARATSSAYSLLCLAPLLLIRPRQRCHHIAGHNAQWSEQTTKLTHGD